MNSLGDKNDAVVRLNTLSTQVMREEGIAVVDVYSPLAARLDLAAGDNYHWHATAHLLITEKISKRAATALAVGH